MIGKTILTWMDAEDRTLSFLARTAGVNVEMLVALITGGGVATPEELSALELAMDLPRGTLEPGSIPADPTAGPDDPLHCLTVKEVAALLQVSEDTVRAEIERGALGSITIGQRVKRVPKAALEKRLSTWREAGGETGSR